MSLKKNPTGEFSFQCYRFSQPFSGSLIEPLKR